MASNKVGRIEVRGDKELIAKLKRMGVNVSGVLEDAVRAGATMIERDADRMAPNPFIDQNVAKRTPDMVQIDVGPDREHWYYRFWEFGTSAHGPVRKEAMKIYYEGQFVTFTRGQVPGLGARPFLRPAYQNNRTAAEAKISEAIYTVVIRETHG